MEKVKGALKETADTFTQLAPVAGMVARTGMAYMGSRDANAGLESTRQQVSVERSLAEARASRDEADRARRLQSALSSQAALNAGRGLDMNTLAGVEAGARDAFDRDIQTIQINKMTRNTMLDFTEADAAKTAASTSRNGWIRALTGNAESLFYRNVTPTKKVDPYKGFRSMRDSDV
jgi:hypothetical protein